MSRRVGLLGGTFDPVHFAHLRTALEVAEALDLPEVRFVPAKLPPHKPDEAITPAEHRVAMLRLAVRGEPRFRVDLRELSRDGPSYTVETIRSVVAEGREPTFIMGADQYLELASWREPEALLALCDHAVMTRPGYEPAPIERVAPLAAAGRFWYDPAVSGYRHETGRTLRFVTVTRMEISSTRIRELVRAGRSIAYLAPRAVEGYIRSRQLYRGGPPRFC